MLIRHDRRDRFPWAPLSLFPQGDSRPTLARDATWQLESECVCGILSLRHVEMRECIVFHSRRVACQRRFSASPPGWIAPCRYAASPLQSGKASPRWFNTFRKQFSSGSEPAGQSHETVPAAVRFSLVPFLYRFLHTERGRSHRQRQGR